MPIESLFIVRGIAPKLPKINVAKSVYLYSFLFIKNSRTLTAQKHNPKVFLHSNGE